MSDSRDAVHVPGKIAGLNFKAIIRNPLSFSLAVLFIVVLQNIITTGPAFFHISITNGLLSGYIPNILDEAGELIIVTLGMTLVTAVAGGQDISVGSIMAISAGFCGLLLNGADYRSEVFHNPYWLAILAGLAGGALCGAFNGFMVAVLRIQPMIASLILFTAGRSIAKVITFGQTVYIMNPVYKYLGVQIPGVPIRTTIIVAAVMVVLVVLAVRLTSMGLYIQSIGINSSASRLVGINSTLIKFMTFVLCGVLAGVAGLVGSSSIGSVNSSELGLSIEMDAILAVALGGNLLGGGKFTIAGSVIGACIIQAITTTLYAMSVRADQLYVFKALIIIVVIVVSSEVFKDQFRKLMSKTAKIR
jgi:simple sugar transport system permease protein